MSEAMGIDVSHYQGLINWGLVKEEGKQFAILKCQYEAKSHRKDEQFDNNYNGCGYYGIASGVYIYIARASMADIEGDARSLLKHLDGRKLEYGIWLDLEDESLRAKGKAYIRELAYKYAEIFKTAGYYVGIYCNRDWYINLIHDDLKNDFEFWIARYPKLDTGTYNPSSFLKPDTSLAVAWQYSSKGNVKGVDCLCDLDVDFDGAINLIADFDNYNENPFKKPERTLRKGMIGVDIMWLQWELVIRGYDIEIDGIFGDKTLEALLAYQSYAQLKKDGIAGNITIGSLASRGGTK
jgi:GH25 family lysozyme M1 (1,4-beta-N-acetylmuramidase)